MKTLTLALILLALAWGAFAFGAPYAWAYWPLAAMAAVAGALGLAIGRTVTSRSLVMALALVASAMSLQLVPLGEPALRALSPEAPAALMQLDPVFANTAESRHSLSINAPATREALALFGAFALLLIGASSLLRVTGAERLVAGITVIGVVMAMAGIIQEPLYQGKIYGFWTPEQGYDAFGPYVNQNHFAGWMLMALPLALALLCMRVATGKRTGTRDFRTRLLWLSTPDAGKLIIGGLAGAVMALSLVLTLSRSGIAAFGIAILIMGGIVARRGASGSRKIVTLAFLGAMALAVVGVTGIEAITARFTVTGVQDFASRRAAWGDAIDVAKRFPLTGTGVNTYGDAMLLYQTHETDTYHYSAAHNDYLQVMAEGGLLVAVPALVALIALALAVRRRLREDRESSYYWLRAGALAGLVAIAIQELADFSLQLPGNAALFAVLCAIAIHRRPTRTTSSIRATIPAFRSSANGSS